MKVVIYHQRAANTAAIAFCGAPASPDKTVNNYRKDIPAGGRVCLRCLRRMAGMRINAKMR